MARASNQKAAVTPPFVFHSVQDHPRISATNNRMRSRRFAIVSHIVLAEYSWTVGQAKKHGLVEYNGFSPLNPINSTHPRSTIFRTTAPLVQRTSYMSTGDSSPCGSHRRANAHRNGENLPDTRRVISQSRVPRADSGSMRVIHTRAADGGFRPTRVVLADDPPPT